MNPARQNKNRSESAPDLFLGTLASCRRVDNGLAGGTPALPGIALTVLGMLLAVGPRAIAQTTNAPAATNATDYSSFQIVVERNIFDPNRYAHTAHKRGHAISKSAPNFLLVGTMNSRKGMIAFFDGNDPDYRKVLSLDGVIAGYKVVEITQRGVKLAAAGQPVVMLVGAQMRQENKGEWQLAGVGELAASAATTVSEATTADGTPAASPAPNSADEPNDVLKKLMQQREQELK